MNQQTLRQERNQIIDMMTGSVKPPVPSTIRIHCFDFEVPEDFILDHEAKTPVITVKYQQGQETAAAYHISGSDMNNIDFRYWKHIERRIQQAIRDQS